MRRPWRRIFVALGALLAVVACSREHGAVAPSFERMLTQPRYTPYGASGFFPDGRAMRLPPSGTVSRERVADSSLVPAVGAEREARPARPLPVTRELLDTGRERFDIYCAVCHGVLGDGRSVVASNMVAAPPPSLLSARVRSSSSAALFRIITDGYGRMPGYAAELPVRQRWAVAAYVRRLRARP